ncbi:Ig-like domain (group 3) [Desulfonispora thiosulfatigenes DSM 11270]|uniref:Ig-like domain (Group 3) n=1 Tax=Desulfonispora thiosulfatigenes DSM 11270 TaxID=656914 RepID=A0A1W1V475_DESTI|nr:S-layer homology domain-containing protein [Desulfonispora thiosulfatigenes]SMB87821.1 Ig-like domain (group 3) [Desulfonispora thiosulfatigenes DSM 11270]
MDLKIRNFKRALSVAIIFFMILTMIPLEASAFTLSDISNHWAKNTINQWIDKNLVNGYPDGTFRPDKSITRAEFMALVNKSFGFTNEVNIDYVDVPKDAWYQSTVARAKAAGYIGGYPDASMRPENLISRQEAASIVAKIKGLNHDLNAANIFSDSNDIANWSKGAVGATVESGYIGGYPDKTFKPLGNITRAESLVVLNRAAFNDGNIKEIKVFDKKGTYGLENEVEVINSNVSVKADGVILQNLHIKGNLIIADEVGDGDVTLNNITVDGDTFVRGGGKDSIHINGGSYNKIIVEETPGKKIRIVSKNAKNINVVISKYAANESIILEGTFENVQIEADNAEIKTQNDTIIKKMIVASKVKGSKITINKNTRVEEMVIEAGIKIKGQGIIAKAVVKADNVIYEKAPQQQSIDSKVKIEPVVSQVAAGSGVSGGGSSGGSSTDFVSAINIATTPDISGGVDNDAVVTVTLTTATSGADIYYTIDGTNPATSASKVLYDTANKPMIKTENIAGETITIKAIGIKTGYTNSAVAEKEIVFNAASISITAIRVSSNPAKITYYEGESLDLTGLQVELTYSDTSKENVVLGEFAAKGITTNPVNGSSLTVAEHNDKPIVVICNGKLAESGDKLRVLAAAMPVTSISLNKSSLELVAGGNETLTATVVPANATNKSVTWSSDNSAVATVDQTGKVTAVAAGTATITVTTVEGSFTAECVVTVTPSEFAGGDGAPGNPYQIETAEQLNNVRNHLDKYYILTDDIDLLSYASWVPIGNVYASPFYGSFDGNGHTISNLKITSSDGLRMFGLFGYVIDATIKNLQIRDAYVVPSHSYEQQVGILAGYTARTTISNCSTSGIVGGSATYMTAFHIGGLVGQITNETVVDSSFSRANVISSGSGLIDDAQPDTIIKNSYSSGTVSDGAGFVRSISGTVENCYTIATVSYGNLFASYISDNNNVTGCYYQNIAGGPEAVGSGSVTGIIGVDEVDMKKQSTFMGWDFVNIWGINPDKNEGYPFLRWQGYEPILDVTKPVTGVSLNKLSLELVVGGNETLIATVAPADASNKGVVWSSDNSNVATVDSNGEVTAVSGGTVNITVATVDGGKTATCVVHVKSTDATLSDLTVNGTTVEGFAAATLAYNIEFAIGTTEVPIVEATVNNTGKANAIVTHAESLPGTTTVVVTAEDGTTTMTYTINFTVEKEPLSVTVTKAVNAPIAIPEIPTIQYLSNQNQVTVEQIGNSVTISGSLGALVSYAQPGQEDNHKYVVLLVETGEASVEGISYNGVEMDITAERYYNGKFGGIEEGTFVQWIKADEVVNTPMIFNLSKAGKTDTEITISFKDIPLTLEGIAITTPAKTEYKVGETLDITGMVVTGTYSDSSTKEETITVDNVTGFDSSAVIAEQTLTITVGGKTTSYTISVVKADGPALTGVTADDNENTLTGITEAMEFSTNGTDWTKYNGSNLPDLTGTVALQVRVAATETHTAGATTTFNFTVGASVSSIIATNGTVTITLAEKPKEAPVEGDFTATATIDGGSAESLALTNFVYDGNVTVTYTFNPIAQTESEQSVLVAVTLAGNETVAPAYTVEALVLGIIGNLLDADSGANLTGVLYTRDSSIYYNQVDTTGTWGTETLIGTSTEGSLDVDSTGNPHVAYTTAGKIGYRMYDGSNWTDEVLIESNNAGSCSKPDIAVDGSGYAHITYTDTMGNTGDDYDKPDIMYATNKSGSFVKELTFNGNGTYNFSNKVDYTYYNNGKPYGSVIVVTGSGDYYIVSQKSHRENTGQVYNTYSLVVKSNLAEGSIEGLSSDVYNIYDLTSGGGKVVALYGHSGSKTAELTINGATITFDNATTLPGGSVNSVATDGSDIVVGGVIDGKLQTFYNGAVSVYNDNIVKNGTKVSVEYVNTKFYAIYTDNYDGRIKVVEI